MELPLVLPVLVGQPVERLGLARAGVVHQHVHRPKTPPALGHDEPRSIRLCHVGAETIARPRDLEYLRSLVREHPRGGKADPAARTGDYARLAAQPEIHGPASCQAGVSPRTPPDWRGAACAPRAEPPAGCPRPCPPSPRVWRMWPRRCAEPRARLAPRAARGRVAAALDRSRRARRPRSSPRAIPG